MRTRVQKKVVRPRGVQKVLQSHLCAPACEPFGPPTPPKSSIASAPQPELLGYLLSFAGKHEFLFYGGVSRAWRSTWLSTASSRCSVAAANNAAEKRTGCSATREKGEPLPATPSNGEGGAQHRKSPSPTRSQTPPPFSATKTSVAAALASKARLKLALASGLAWDKKLAKAAATFDDGGEALQCAIDNKVLSPQDDAAAADVCRWAAAANRLGTLQWARKTHGFAWDERTAAAAASSGHFELLRWCRTNGAPWGPETSAVAAERGDLDMLRWALANNCPWSADVYPRAARRGHLHVLKWAWKDGCPWGWGMAVCHAAAEGGQLETLRWLRDKNCSWGPETCARAAAAGHLELLQFCRANGCPWDAETCRVAGKCKNARVLEWVHAAGGCRCEHDKEASPAMVPGVAAKTPAPLIAVPQFEAASAVTATMAVVMFRPGVAGG